MKDLLTVLALLVVLVLIGAAAAILEPRDNGARFEIWGTGGGEK